MKILMVDDSKFNIMFLAKAIELHLGKDYQIIGANKIEQDKKLLTEHKFDFALIDYHIDTNNGEESGVELAKYIDENYPKLGYIYLSSCVKEKIVGAKIERNLGKIFNEEFINKLKKII